MNRNKIIVLALIAILAVAGIAGLTVYLLRNAGDNRQNVPAKTDDLPDASDLPLGVDATLNAKASTVEADARKMMETDPISAAKKYDEAAALYKDANNLGKAADMSDSARTAATMTPAQDPEIGEPVISN